LPLCPLVLSLLATRPRAAHEVARELEHYPAAKQTLDRLKAAGLVRRRGTQYQLTRRGRRELRFQRLLWTRAYEHMFV
jgi:DNA-binding PadR family transcriptional regulator